MQKQFAEASQAFRNAIAFNPFDAAAWSSLGDCEQIQGHGSEARGAYESSLSLIPGQAETLLKMAYLLEKQGASCEAVTRVRQALASDANYPPAVSTLARLQLALGEADQALESISYLLNRHSSCAAHSQLLHTMQYTAQATPQGLLDAHARWDQIYARPMFPIGRAPRPGGPPGRPLRIGFLSDELSLSPISFLVLPGFEQLSKEQCFTICYCDRQRVDDWEMRFRAAADVWRATTGLSNDEIAAQVVRDEIDILIDLSGHLTARLLVFAAKPAPVQMTWVGYVGTTGMTAIDYLLADRHHVRPNEEAYYTEAILRMPNGYVCYGPPQYAPEVGPLAARANRRITFGCFNNPAKYSPDVLELWSEILGRVPASQLLLKYGGLQQPELQNRLRSAFVKRGIDEARIVFEGRSQHGELLHAYHRVDLALDTQPYSGGLTTCEALWMGVPVITWPGKTFAGRHSVSHMTNAGYPQFVAADPEGYVELAVEWANRLEELAAIRATMRERVRESPLCDAPRFARDFLEVLSRAWEEKSRASMQS